MTAADDTVRTAEMLLQRWLANKPPPAFVERRVSRPPDPQDQKAWQELTAEINSIRAQSHTHHTPIDPQASEIRVSDGVTIGLLDAQAFKQHLKDLATAEEWLSRLINLGPSLLPEQRMQALECLGYVRTELSIEWPGNTWVFGQLNPFTQPFREAYTTCEKAWDEAIHLGDFFRAHRALYNLARPVQDVYSDFEKARRALFLCLVYLETHIQEQGEPKERYWATRRVDILHRLVEACVQDGFALEDFASHLKSPHVGRSRPRVPTIHQLEVHNTDPLELIAPLSLSFPDVLPQLGNARVVLSYAHGRRYSTLSLYNGSKVLIKRQDPDSISGSGLDRFLRPTNVDFGGRPNGPQQQLEWETGVDVLSLEPRAASPWVVRLGQVLEPENLEVPWDRGLFDVLIAPIEKHFREWDTRHLIIAPDGGLNLVPFHLLRSSAGEYLSDRFAISYAQNFRVLNDAIARRDAPKASAVLLVKDPTDSLLHAELEARLILACWGASRVKILDRTDATREGIAAAVREAEVVHFCTHGSIDTRRKHESGLQIKGGQWLTLEEIEDLPIRRGALVFLSACETARVKLSDRTTVTGICPSFFSAGAATVISTFWKVSGLSTALLAGRFYKAYLEPNVGPLEALGRSVSWLRTVTSQEVEELAGGAAAWSQGPHPYADPYYWGAFALYGAW